MFDQIRIPIIREAGGKLAQDPHAFLDLPQQQTTAVTGDRSTVELRANQRSNVRIMQANRHSYPPDAQVNHFHKH